MRCEPLGDRRCSAWRRDRKREVSICGVEIRFAHGPDDIVFHGGRGRLRMRRNQFETDPADLVTNPPDLNLADKWKGRENNARPHLKNWLDCIRTRGIPNAPVEAGHRTITICHLANIARELNRPLEWDPATEQFADDNKANALLNRPRRAGFKLCQAPHREVDGAIRMNKS